jgi:hypothetical protein
VSTTSILLLIIAIETSLVVGFVCGLLVMRRSARARREEDDVQRELWLEEGRFTAHHHAGAKVQTLGGLTATPSADERVGQRRSAI